MSFAAGEILQSLAHGTPVLHTSFERAVGGEPTGKSSNLPTPYSSEDSTTKYSD